MKTTLEITDSLMIRARKVAIELRTPFRKLVEAALREYLSRGLHRPQKREGTKRTLQLTIVDGGLPKDLDVANRTSMHEWLGRNR